LTSASPTERKADPKSTLCVAKRQIVLAGRLNSTGQAFA
jgi:hypothetical protein